MPERLIDELTPLGGRSLALATASWMVIAGVTAGALDDGLTVAAVSYLAVAVIAAGIVGLLAAAYHASRPYLRLRQRVRRHVRRGRDHRGHFRSESRDLFIAGRRHGLATSLVVLHAPDAWAASRPGLDTLRGQVIALPGTSVRGWQAYRMVEVTYNPRRVPVIWDEADRLARTTPRPRRQALDEATLRRLVGQLERSAIVTAVTAR